MSALSDKVAIVTGASSGIGEATALALAKRGARVVLAARRLDRLERVTRSIVGAGGHGMHVQCDVRDRAQVDGMIAQAKTTFGQIDVLINNAGVMHLSPMASCRYEDWDGIIDVNVKGALYAIGAVLPAMLEQKSGHIVNVSSVAGRLVFSTATVYCASKHALHAISEGLRMELAERSLRDGNTIRVTTVAPGVVKTELRDSILDPATREAIRPYYESIPEELTSKDIARSIVSALEAPAHVSFNEILIRPTGQPR